MAAASGLNMLLLFDDCGILAVTVPCVDEVFRLVFSDTDTFVDFSSVSAISTLALRDGDEDELFPFESLFITPKNVLLLWFSRPKPKAVAVPTS